MQRNSGRSSRPKVNVTSGQMSNQNAARSGERTPPRCPWLNPGLHGDKPAIDGVSGNTYEFVRSDKPDNNESAVTTADAFASPLWDGATAGTWIQLPHRSYSSNVWNFSLRPGFSRACVRSASQVSREVVIAESVERTEQRRRGVGLARKGEGVGCVDGLGGDRAAADLRFEHICFETARTPC